MIVGDIDQPGAAADRQPAQGHGVAGIELALGVGRIREDAGERRGERDGAEQGPVAIGPG